MTHDEFMNEVRRTNERRMNHKGRTDAEQLRERIMSGKRTNEEYLALQEELKSFLEFNPSDEDVKHLQGCGESLSMICSAIKEGKL